MRESVGFIWRPDMGLMITVTGPELSYVRTAPQTTAVRKERPLREGLANGSNATVSARLNLVPIRQALAPGAVVPDQWTNCDAASVTQHPPVPIRRRMLLASSGRLRRDASQDLNKLRCTSASGAMSDFRRTTASHAR